MHCTHIPTKLKATRTGRGFAGLLVAVVMTMPALMPVSMADDVLAHDALTTQTESSNYLKGVEAYRAGEYRQAFDAWSLGAYEEDAESQYNLGVLYLEGRGVDRDARQARSWFLRAAQKNHPEAQYNLGHMSLSGMVVEKDMDAAIEWWRRSAEAGYPQAQFNYGRALYLGVNGEADPVAGLRLIRQAASNGDARAQKYLNENRAEVAAVRGSDVSSPEFSPREMPPKKPDAAPEPRVIALEPLPVKSRPSGRDMPEVTRLEDETPKVIALPALSPDSENDAAQQDSPVVVIRARSEERAPEAPRSDIKQQAGSEPAVLKIVRDETPVLHDYFLRTADKPVPLYESVDSDSPIDTLTGKTLLNVRAVEGDKLLVDALNRSEVWVLGLGIKLIDGMAVSMSKSVPMFNEPGGYQIGLLPEGQAMLVLEQRKGWRKLSLVRRISGWIDVNSLADSGETTPQLKARWEAGLRGLAMSKQGIN